MTPPQPPAAAAAVFGDQLERAVAFAGLLTGAAIERGLLGPREADRVWERHLLNSAALRDVVPVHASVVDIGSGAGLPGIPLWLARPDLRMTLVEPMQRRVEFLYECILQLGITVEVFRGRAEELPSQSADVAVARAVAPLQRLLPLVVPVLRRPGRVAALKGRTAEVEISSATPLLRRWPGATLTLDEVPTGGAESARIVRLDLPAVDRARGSGAA